MIGSAVRGFLAYKTLGLAGSLAGRGARGSAPRSARSSRGGEGAADSGGRFLATLNPLAAIRRRHQRRWIDPEPDMLKMKLRRPTEPNSTSCTRRSVADDLDDPDRTMPWQQESPPQTPGLLGPRGGINPDARRGRKYRRVVPPERGMLNVRLRQNSPGAAPGMYPMRRRVADDVDDPHSSPGARSAQPQSGRGLITTTGAVNPQARARNPLPEKISPEPGMLPLTLQPKRPDPNAPARPAPQPPDPRARRPRPQQALINQYGAVTHNARARKSRRRTEGPNKGEQP